MQLFSPFSDLKTKQKHCTQQQQDFFFLRADFQDFQDGACTEPQRCWSCVADTFADAGIPANNLPPRAC